MGIIFAQLGRPAEALAAFEQAQGLGYESPLLYSWWAQVLFEMGSLDEALAALEQLLQLDQAYTAKVYSGRGIILEAMGRPEDAVLAYAQSIRVEMSADTCLRLCALLVKLRREGEALAFW